MCEAAEWTVAERHEPLAGFVAHQQRPPWRDQVPLPPGEVR